MSFLCRKADEQDLLALCRLFESGVRAMEEQGLDQWRWGIYPSEAVLTEDVAQGSIYVLEDEGELAAAFVINGDQDPQYKTLCWHFGVRPAVLHRLVVDPTRQRRGVGRESMAHVMRLAREMGCDSLRLDTYLKNERALALYDGLGMRRVGQVSFDFRPTRFQCFEMPLTYDCPLLPLKMRPAYRCFPELPWGGNKLKELFGKDIPNDRTGESMEISVIPGLVSRAENGEGLDELLAVYGERLQGTAIHGPFPLLLKLLDAKDTLSVQVHPNDAYAGSHENGKLGKTEAWVILQADPGAELVYGLTPGVTREELENAAGEGAAIEKYLRRVKIKEGDVCFIPAGCVHAIGAGVCLYEIQQSSDVTYRFYDWDRADASGKKRPLRIRQAIDVSDLSFHLDPVPRTPGTGFQPLLRNPVFELDRLHVSGKLSIEPDPRRFAFLTAMDSLLLCWENDAMELKKGDSVMLPAKRPPLTLHGVGEALLAAPTVEDA
jgi:mannose-6-phosphate isomerase